MFEPHRTDLIELDVFLHAETEADYVISREGDQRFRAWVPKSLTELERNPHHYLVKVTLPKWKAEEKGLVDG